MSRVIKRAVLVGIICATPQLGLAQDREFPVLNSVGRYFGIGYTRGGYHAPRDGRFDIVTDHHPASEYRSGGLPQPAMPYYFHAPATYPAPPATIEVPAERVPAERVPAASALPEAATVPPVTSSVTSQPIANLHRLPNEAAAGFESAIATTPIAPPSSSTQPLQQSPPAVLTSPRDRIEVRELAPETSPSDALLDGHRAQPLPSQRPFQVPAQMPAPVPARGAAYPIVEAELSQQAAEPSVPANPGVAQRQPPLPSNPRRSPLPTAVNRYRGSQNPSNSQNPNH